MAESFISAQIVAQRLQCSIEKVWELARTGKIPSVRLGGTGHSTGHYRFVWEDVVKAIKKN